jgi:hypothetical protein
VKPEATSSTEAVKTLRIQVSDEITDRLGLSPL